MSARWMGRCPGCGAYNTMVEEVTAPNPRGGAARPSPKPTPLREVAPDTIARMPTGLDEVDRVLGGGVVPGALMLLGGDPGIGKSTLMLQIAANAARDGPVLYVSAEESLAQTRLRMERVAPDAPAGVHLLADGRLSAMESALSAESWRLVVVDSLQTVYDEEADSAPGSVGQVRAVASRLMHYAKSAAVPVFLVGHVNKEGSSGPARR